MGILNILLYPDPRLKKRAAPVEAIDDRVCELAESMVETMYDAPGIGLAAPQIGVSKRVIVMDCSKKDEDRQPRILLNPEIVWRSPETATEEEGCLSFPNQFAEIERAAEVTVKFENLDGESVDEKFSGLWARCVQHEVDHLDGKLFIDHVSLVKREIIRRKLKKELRERQKS